MRGVAKQRATRYMLRRSFGGVSVTQRLASTVSLCLCAVVIACSDSSGPRADSSELDVVFLDGGARLNTLHSGDPPAITGLKNALPFASTNRAVLLLTESGSGPSKVRRLNLFHLDGRLDSLAIPIPHITTAGAISPDGSRLAFASAVFGTIDKVFLHTVHLSTMARDSLDVSDRDDAPAAPFIIFSTPVFSPSGDSVAFLLPNSIGVQVLLYEVSSKRIEVFPVPVPVTTFARLLPGWPRWTRAEGIRFLARRFSGNNGTDTLVVMSVNPRQRQSHAQILYRASTPDSLPIQDAAIYSFDARGESVAFGMQSNGRTGVFAIREGTGIVEPLLYDRAVSPSLPLIVP
ncbi:MAG: hypothetical protein ABR543_03485 [Gemmatimonadaceae bacterium]